MVADLWICVSLWQVLLVPREKPVDSKPLLIVDDDTDLAAMLKEYLAAEGLELAATASGADGLREARRGEYALIILDVMLPGLSGFELLRQLRESGAQTPVLMLTARGDDVDRIVGLEMGADDYLAKPFNPRELVARIKAILRRTQDQQADAQMELDVGPLRALPKEREVLLRGQPLKLTNAEFVVLFTLMRTPGDVVSRSTLTRAALGRQLLPDDRSLDTHISNLRKKLVTNGTADPKIRSVRGSGYLLVAAAELT